MPALVTLTTTTLTTRVNAADSSVNLASTTGVLPGYRLYVDQELLGVLRLGLNTSVDVVRGVDGTAATAHASSQTVTIGQGDQFYLSDPVGPPPSEVLVTPWINVLTGAQWTAQGDETGPNVQARWWARTEHTHGTGALGVRTDVAAASVTTVT